MKVLPKGITERVWSSKPSLSMALYEVNAVGELQKLSTCTPSNRGLFSYTDMVMPNKDCYCIAVDEDEGRAIGVAAYKIGSPVLELIFSVSKLRAGANRIDILDNDGQIVMTVESVATDLYMVGNEALLVSDVTILEDGQYMVAMNYGDFKRYTKPAAMNYGQVDFLKGKIILEPGFNMIAWQGKGTGSFVSKDGNVISNVANCIAAQLNTKYGASSWRGCRTYDEATGNFLDYINGVTPDDAAGNFNLTISDNGNREVKGIEFSSLENFSMELEYF